MNGEDVKRHRKKLGMSVEEFADAVGVHWTTVYRWERDETAPAEPVARMIRMLTEGAA